MTDFWVGVIVPFWVRLILDQNMGSREDGAVQEGRPREETGRDVRLRARFPQLTRGARRIFQEGKLV